MVNFMETSINEMRGTPERAFKSIMEGINTGNLDALMLLYEPGAAFAIQPGTLTHGEAGVRQALAGFVAMKGKLDLKVTRVLQAGDLALATATWSFTGTGSDGETREAGFQIRGCPAPSGRWFLALRHRQSLGNRLKIPRLLEP